MKGRRGSGRVGKEEGEGQAYLDEGENVFCSPDAERAGERGRVGKQVIAPTSSRVRLCHGNEESAVNEE